MENHTPPKISKKFFILSNFFLIFTIGLLILSVPVLAVDKEKEIKPDKDKFLVLEEIQPLKEKIVSDKAYIFTPDGYVKLKKDDLSLENFALGKGIIAIDGGYKEEVEVTFYTNMPNTPFSVLHYQGITEDKHTVRKLGEVMIEKIYSDDKGRVTYTTNTFSTQILSFTDPLEHDNAEETTGYYLNYFFTDYDRVRILSTDLGIVATNLEGYMTSSEAFESNEVWSNSDVTLTLQYRGYTPNQDPKFNLKSEADSGEWSYDITVRAYDEVDDTTYVEDTFEWTKPASTVTGVTATQNLSDPTIKYVNQSFSFFLSDYFDNFVTGGVFFKDTNCNNTNYLNMTVSGDYSIVEGASDCYVLLGQDSNVTDDGGSYTNPLHYSFDTYGTGTDIIVYGTSLMEHNFTPFTLVAYDDTLSGNATADFVTLQIQEGGGTSYDLTTDLLAYYTFDDVDVTSTNADDVTGNGNTATNFNSVTTGVIGKSNEAFQFDGTNDYLSVATVLSTQITASDFSYFMWVKPDATLSDGTGTFEAFTWGDQGSNGHRLYYYDGNLNFAVLTSTWVTTSYDTDLTAGTWYHIGVVFDDTANKQMLYFNGVNVANTTQTDSLSFSGATSIGARGISSPGQYFDGVIDEMLITNTVLTPAEVQIIYDNGADGYDGLIGEVTAIPPVQINNFADPITLEYDELVYFDFDDYFSGYDQILIDFNASGITETLNVTINDTVGVSYNDSYIEFQLEGTTSIIRWYITTLLNNYTSPLTIYACYMNACINDTTTLTVNPVSISPTPPTIIQSFNSSYTLDENDYTSFNLGGYFSNYNGAEISYQDEQSNTTQTILFFIGDAQECITEDYISICARTLSTQILLEISTYETALDDVITINATNPYGEVSQSFLVIVEEPSEETSYGMIVSFFIGLFPDSETLTTSQALGYAILAIILSIGAVLIGASQVNISGTVMGVLASIVAIFEVMFFVTIGYIPVIFVVVLGLIGVVIGYAVMNKSGIGGA